MMLTITNDQTNKMQNQRQVLDVENTSDRYIEKEDARLGVSIFSKRSLVHNIGTHMTIYLKMSRCADLNKNNA